MRFCVSLALLAMLSPLHLLGYSGVAKNGYAGSRACSSCHRNIADKQAKTAMAQTWHGALSSSLPDGFVARTESDEVRRTANGVEYVITLPDGSKRAIPVETIVGGQRHGLSFLLRIHNVDAYKLDRPILAEARLAYNTAHRELVLSPGFSADKPTTYEDSVGDVLSTTFEQKCLACHVKPNSLGAGPKGGVQCESCHGPALNHISAVGRGKPAEGVINPRRLNAAGQMAICAKCHTGFSFQSDPLPDDLLVSNQVNAIERAECFVQSGGRVGCTSCHDPHEDARNVPARTVVTCQSCHSGKAKGHAGICPIQPGGDCVGCHMPSIAKGAFHMTDHWIRVHQEQRTPSRAQDVALRSQVTPLKEFLRVLAVPNEEQAQAARKRVASGEPFGHVAIELSTDPTAAGGGYIGEVELASLDQRLRDTAARLWYGETSSPIHLGDHYLILNRLARDFKYEAGRLFQEASELRSRGNAKDATEKARLALAEYPYFLRAMIFMATTLGEAGDVARASEILRFAVQSYPNDASAQFNLGLTLAERPTEQIAAFERAIELDPDMVAAYESLGAAQYGAGKSAVAMQTFQKGLFVDPLSAKLNYDLGLVLSKVGYPEEGERRIGLARATDPSIVSKKP